MTPFDLDFQFKLEVEVLFWKKLTPEPDIGFISSNDVTNSFNHNLMTSLTPPCFSDKIVKSCLEITAVKRQILEI